jgi:serine/threonine-protein kinase
MNDSDSSPPQGLVDALADRYTIGRRVGEGGMATVYLAEDVKHDRNVAIKVLKPELAAVIGGERFVSEIKTTAALQHPHILPLFDSGEADGFLFYVMPFVDGETLREKLDREKQLSVEESVKIASAVASALHYAHGQGIVHRDIKPANILIHAGEPVVADFGIALAISAAGGGRLTETGMSVGTPHYMSPEQATADRDVNARSDIYSVAAVAYEMLTGDPPHTGSSAQAVLMRILTEEPRDVADVRKAVPANVRDAVRKGLEKLPADRFETAEEFSRALGDTAFRTERTVQAIAPEAATGGGGSSWRLASITAIPALLLGFVIAWGLRPDSAMPREVTRTELIPEGRWAGAFRRSVSISADGRTVAWVDSAGVLVRRLNDLEATGVEGTDGSELSVGLSPDGGRIVFTRLSGENGVVVAPVGGGSATVLVGQAARAAFWGADDWIYFQPSGQTLARIRPSGGAVDTLIRMAGSTDAVQYVEAVQPFEDRLVIVTWFAFDDNTVKTETHVVDLDSRETRKLADGVAIVGRVPGHDYLLFGQGDAAVDGSVESLVAPFDVRTGELTGPMIPYPTGRHPFAFTRDGTALERLPGGGEAPVLSIVDRTGEGHALPNVPDDMSRAVPSPRGDLVAILTDEEVMDLRADLWLYALPEGPATPLLRGTDGNSPHWTPDGEALLIANAAGDTLWSVPIDGTPPRSLWTVGDEPYSISGASMAPDGSVLVVDNRIGRPDTGLIIGPGGETRPLEDDPGYDPGFPVVSFDNEWVAYSSYRTGEQEIWIRRFDGSGAPIRVSLNGGLWPRWAHSSLELLYIDGDTCQGRCSWASARIGPGGRVLSRTTLNNVPSAGFTFIMPGDSTFTSLQFPGRGGPPVILAQNWDVEFAGWLESVGPEGN